MVNLHEQLPDLLAKAAVCEYFQDIYFLEKQHNDFESHKLKLRKLVNLMD